MDTLEWTILGPAAVLGKVRCRCSCGKEKDVNIKNIRSGRSLSCGHARDARFAERSRNKKGAAHHSHKHGGVGTSEYDAWAKAKNRCGNPHAPHYEDYGGRGITVCVRWRAFEYFLEDMGPRPSPKHSIDRVDNDGGYWCGHPDCGECANAGRTKTNCRWALPDTQQRNRRNNRMVEHDGRTQCLQAWADEYGIESNVLAARLDMGWDFTRAATAPVQKKKKLSPEVRAEIRARYVKGSWEHGVPALARHYGVNPKAIIVVLQDAGVSTS